MKRNQKAARKAVSIITSIAFLVAFVSSVFTYSKGERFCDSIYKDESFERAVEEALEQ